jgi:major membrane immunogen (membrane-anchored lipoprotein)
MRSSFLLFYCFFAMWVTPMFAGVSVTAPKNGSTVSSPVQYVATASSSCSEGVASIGIYTAPNQLAYVVNASSLNANLNLSPGTYNTTVQEWDNCGGSSKTPIAITVGSGGGGVSVTAPTNNSQVASPVNYIASASSSCSKGVAAMGIYTAPNQLAYTTNGASLNTSLSLSPGTYNTTVQEWDNCGGSSSKPVAITVGSGGDPSVKVTSPANNSTVSSPVQYVATAVTNCSKGVAAIGIYTASGVLAYTSNGASLDTSLSLAAGTYNTTVQEWDNCGGSAKTPITITVSGGGSSGGGTFWSLQSETSGWTGYGLLPPSYAICSGCKPSGPNVTWSWTPYISNPSLDGKSVKTTIGGTEAFADVLWNNHLIGDFSSQGLPDSNKTLTPTLHNFTYDVWFYLSNNTAPQALEFDINQFVNGESYIWGHECRVAGGNEWDTWSNPGQYWVPSGIGCWPVVGWNHLVLKVQRTSDGHLLFESISLNGVTNTLNRYDSPTNTSWYGITVNYQIDGNKSQTPYTVYLDELNFTWQP